MDLKGLNNIEKDFFDIDEENKVAHMKLEFSNPNEIFDQNSITKIPTLNDDFIEWLGIAFEYCPKKYKIDLDITFDDLNGYSTEELNTIFVKNVALEFKRYKRKANLKNKIAYNLIIIGLIFLISMILLTSLWKEENIAKDIISYIFDIATTITFWEALTILIVENKERRDYMKNIAKRFKSINFYQKDKK